MPVNNSFITVKTIKNDLTISVQNNHNFERQDQNYDLQ